MAPDVLFTAEQIQERVRAMARMIASAPLVPNVAMPVLVGGFVFAADLIRALAWEGVALDVEMIWLRSYGDKRVACAISTDAMDQLDGSSRTPPAQREQQFLRLRERIEARAARKFSDAELEGNPPGVILRGIDFR